MDALTILIIYLVFFTLAFIWRTILVILNINHIKAHKDNQPAFVDQIMDKETYQKSVQYSIVRNKFSLITSTVSSILVLVLILSGAFGLFDSLLSRLNLGIYLQGILYFFIMALVFQLFSLPFSLYSQFVIEEKFGFNKMTLKLYFLDMLKGLVISAILFTPVILALFWFMDNTGSLWWVFAFGFYTLFQLFIVIIYPSVIAPLFNKFTPLTPGSLKDRIMALLEKVSYKSKGIFIMDGSKRSKHSNAYFTGLGKTKRIVLFDTLINSMDEDQVTSVLAHEIGHAKKKHIIKNLIFTLIGTLIGFFIISLLLNYTPLYLAFGFKQVSYHGILIILSFCSSAFTFFLLPLFALLSRKYEYEADRFVMQALGQVEPFKQALISLSRENLSNLTPHPLYSFFYYSHPTLIERIAALDRLSTGKNKIV
jgi:STE24 endopeptidase